MPRMNKKPSSRMFPFVDRTLNPLGGRCPYQCTYCWACGLILKYGMKSYRGRPILREAVLKTMVPCETVFVCDMRDMLSPDVSTALVLSIIDWMGNNPLTNFLLLTKNPARYLKFDWPPNAILGATIEGLVAGDPTAYEKYSKAPNQYKRLVAMEEVRWYRPSNKRFVSVEPVLDFDLNQFLGWLLLIDPWGVAIGYDNYGHGLPEPDADKVMQLADILEIHGIKVFFKSIREPVWRADA